ncbi:MAG: 2-dehydro-3-deoxygalactonokinase [Clostridia bacterium]|nr:2-dehydro-3-deoxygalactonokinase [Clostridia bacterium]
MMRYITVDGGTSNTRVMLVQNGQIEDIVRIPFGARAGIENATALRTAIRDGISELLVRHKLKEADIERILASGMITSEFGLCNLPHICAPAGIAELHAQLHEVVLEDISPIPFVFIRGVKTVGTSVADTDMMRGEETELMGVIDEGGEKSLYVLPGSHSKLIETDASGKILRFSTMLTGEMIGALATDTILKDAVDLSIRTYDAQMLLAGCRYAMENGLNEALFKVRILKNLFQKDAMESYSFFLGAVLSAEIKIILASPIRRVVIGGKSQIKRATAELVQALSDKETVTVSDTDVDSSATRGAIRIYEYRA